MTTVEHLLFRVLSRWAAEWTEIDVGRQIIVWRDGPTVDQVWDALTAAGLTGWRLVRSISTRLVVAQVLWLITEDRYPPGISTDQAWDMLWHADLGDVGATGWEVELILTLLQGGHREWVPPESVCGDAGAAELVVAWLLLGGVDLVDALT